MRKSSKAVLLSAAAVLAAGNITWARHISPFVEGFENDTDTYNPDSDGLLGQGTGSITDDPPSGQTPGDQFSSPTGSDWYDGRVPPPPAAPDRPNTLVEEVTTLTHGVPSKSGTHHGEVWFSAVDGPFNRIARPETVAPATSSFSFVMDFYTSAHHAQNLTGTANGLPAFWWTNAVGDATYYGLYLYESGFAPDFRTHSDGLFHYEFKTTGGVLVYDTTSANTWFTLETLVDLSGKNGDPNSGATFTFQNIVRSSTGAILGSTTVATPFDADKVNGPRYGWFTNPEPGLTHIYVDNIGVVIPAASAVSSISLSSTAQNTNLADATNPSGKVGSLVDVTGGNDGNYVSEIDDLTANSNKGSAVIDDVLNSDETMVMLWLIDNTPGDGIDDIGNLIAALDASAAGKYDIARSNATPLDPLYADIQELLLHYPGFSALVRFDPSVALYNNTVFNWDFAANPNVLTDRVAAVPEPAGLTLLAACGAPLLKRRRRRGS